MKKTTENILKITLGILILILLYSKIGAYDIINNILKLDFFLVIALFLIYALVRLMDGYNIYILIKCVDKNTKYLNLFKHYLYSWSIGMFLPSKIGELSLAYFLKEKIRPIKTLAIQLLDKSITIVILILIGLYGIYQMVSKERAILVAILIVLCIPVSLLILKFIKNKFQKLKEKIEVFVQTLKDMSRNHKKEITLNFIVTIIKTIMMALITKIVFTRLDTDISILAIITINAITMLTSLIPISISGLGIKQALGTYLYALIGIAPAIALTQYTVMIIFNYGTASIMASKALIKR